ncbi:EpsG family protein [Megamonas funiformis]|uniref:EpsG family protein n=1 Tax=Megamonas funiformis TaxID=437897 RepID=UPI002430EE8B|nr:EpsG family protein [Megamonas funiformis]
MCYLAGSNGLNFIQLNAILLIFAIGAICYIVYNFSRNYCFVMSLYFLYPFIDCVIQKRFFIASIIGLIGMIFLFKNKKIIFSLLVIISGFIHQAAFGFFIYLLIPVLMKTKKKKIILSSLLFIVILLMPFMVDILSVFFDPEKVEFYFYILHEKIKYPILNFILWSVFHIGFVYVYYRFYKSCKIYIKDESFINFISFIWYMNLISLLIIPLYYWEPTFIRIYRNMILFNYISISLILPKGQIYYKKVFYDALICIIYSIIAFFGVYFILSAGYESIVEPIFLNNILLEIM